MITRIVRMEFVPEKVDDFLGLFNDNKRRIRHFPGVSRLELHRDAKQDNVFFTLSVWDSEESLQAYRRSEVFQAVWAQTKAMFSAGPLAYSLIKEMQVD